MIDVDTVFRDFFAESLMEGDEDFDFTPIMCDKRTNVFQYIQLLVQKWGLGALDLPVITVSTIHGFKGGEADIVFLDLTPAKRINDKEEEIRVFYVGATRAKDTLYINNMGGI
jgi:superfamily I DNA/RNA helicase